MIQASHVIIITSDTARRHNGTLSEHPIADSSFPFVASNLQSMLAYPRHNLACRFPGIRVEAV